MQYTHMKLIVLFAPKDVFPRTGTMHHKITSVFTNFVQSFRLRAFIMVLMYGCIRYVMKYVLANHHVNFVTGLAAKKRDLSENVASPDNANRQ